MPIHFCGLNQPLMFDNRLERYFIHSTLTQELHEISIMFLATPMGFEPTTSSVTGWHSNHLNYGAIFGDPMEN